MKNVIKPGMLCFLVGITKGTAGYEHVGKPVTTVSKNSDGTWEIEPKRPAHTSSGQYIGILSRSAECYLSPIDGGPLGEDVYTTKHIPALDNRQPARV